ncbi:MAG: DUF4007 family protein [Kiritimatiellaeota bacterium]|nr:DUF4007 family protein [Kiritimatiellota bacterium]
MKFSGHETFHVREGWLTKGMLLLRDAPDVLNSKKTFMHDHLGVGSNMGKSIRHWLSVTGLAEPVPAVRGELQLSALGQLILQKDRYLLDPVTWWVLHVNLVCGKETSSSWNWFFNSFYQARFDKKACVEALRRYLMFKQAKIPSYQTLDRDLGCLLSSYARAVPEDASDPEESYDSPFKELALLLFFKESGSYQLNFDKKEIPLAAMGYCLSRSVLTDENRQVNEISVHDAASLENGPGKCFLLAASDLFELIESYSAINNWSDISIGGLAGSRMINYAVKAPLVWVEEHFSSVGKGL